MIQMKRKGVGFGLGEGIWHGDDEIDMNIALYT